ncbi:MAG TPA: right-handed parallel beta-helix repeat-containing protein [Tepidisphaeraceae bacterium]|nr:right-handed parallel beta-helix repeat-containing protein [Tepidisphaeraceae bacterium]
MRDVLSLQPLEPRRLMAVYYVSPGGDDQALGLAAEQAWRTVERVNVQRLRAGDTVLFQAGKSYAGGLYLSTREAGSEARPIVFSTFGKGRATLYSGAASGLEISENAGVAVTNISFVGAGMHASQVSGIYAHVGTAAKPLTYLHFRNVEASGYGHEGLTIVASGAGSSISNVKIERSSFHDNLWGGVNVTGSAVAGVNRNYVVDHVRAYNHPGLQSGTFVTGNGIYLADVEDALVQRCVAYNNGTNGIAPVGIWAAGSKRVTFQYNESYDNRTTSGTDGGGFDFDWDVTDSVMQYNYSHGNDGPGYMLGAGSHVNDGNVVRYNVSENDGRKNGRGGIYLWGNVTRAAIHNNVVYTVPSTDPNLAALRAYDGGADGKVPQNVLVANNVFQTEGGAKLINLSSAIATKSKFTFANNAYYSGTGAFRIQWGSAAHASLAAWRDATGQEKTSAGKASGYQGHPRLAGAGLGGTIGNADLLGSLTAYRLQAKSPLVDRGRAVTPPAGISAVTSDFFAGPALLGPASDIGIHELR